MPVAMVVVDLTVSEEADAAVVVWSQVVPEANSFHCLDQTYCTAGGQNFFLGQNGYDVG